MVYWNLTIYRQRHFDFLKLPLALREAIYELLFEDNKHYPPSKQPVRGSRIRRARGRFYLSYERPVPTNILGTCQQIYYEARSVLYRMRPAQISVGSWIRYTFLLDPIDVAPLTSARKLEIQIEAMTEDGPVEYRQKRKGSIGDMLTNYADALIGSPAGPRRAIRLKFMVSRKGTKPKAEDQKQKHDVSWLSETWHWAQAAEVVKAMRADLKERAPAMNLTLTSNVEGKIPKVKTTRLDASRVWYHKL